MELTQEEKAIRLQQAVLNSTTEEICNIYDTLGYVEMSAPALGLACRFRGLEVVKVLVEKGATFDFPSTEEIEIKYHCHIGEKHANYRVNYRTNYSLYLLKCFRGGLKGARCLQGMKFVKKAKRDDGTSLSFLADKERIAVLNYLLVEREKLFFQPEEMLFFAIFAQDTVVYKALKEQNVMLSEQRVFAMTEGTLADGYWFEFSSLVGKLADKDYINIMQQLSIELSGKSFRFTQKIFDITQKRFYNINIFAFFLAHFRQEKMKKYEIIRSLIDENAVDALAVVEREGWLTTSKKRDEMIAYASQNQKIEALAWLLEFKNRTADLVAEQRRVEKKLMRELNAAPDSVTALRKLWSYEEREDGTLTIINYKGKDSIVVVPERIGKNTVTEIGYAAFAGTYMKSMMRAETIAQHRKITSITLPKTLQKIENYAICNLPLLNEITIPDSVKEFGEGVFQKCPNLVIFCSQGSKAEDYCKEKGFPFQYSVE